MSSISERVSRPPLDMGDDQHLEPLLKPGMAATVESWNRRREELVKGWQEILGHPAFKDFDRTPELMGEVNLPDGHGRLFRQPTGPDTRQLVLLMEPRTAARGQRPGAVIPFYHPDPSAGFDLEKRETIQEAAAVQFGRHLLRQGYTVVCTEAFPYNTVPDPKEDAAFAWWRAAAEELLNRYPGWTGIGKLTWDTRLAVDLLLAQADIDESRVVAMGHSLGGKMAFYAGALDTRVRATICSDFGIGYRFSNWEQPWYHGTRVQDPGLPLNHHHLLALHAPRPFLLIIGNTDGPASWQYLEAARRVYGLLGNEHGVGACTHGDGHRPPERTVRFAYAWLAEQFGSQGPDPNRPL